ncbi:MAG TPA: hypothetical protein VM865_03500 [Acidobacteriaceae bacterium]|jgi:hypothetical protein|nr:hypothetical protein [Acidobacteriaceae bacterium]
MILRLFGLAALSCLLAGVARAQQPPGVAEALAGITSAPSTHTAVTFDRDMLGSILGERPVAALNGVTVESFRFHEPAFYIPENMAALQADFDAAGWKHLVEAGVDPRASATPDKPVTDMWFHMHGAEIDGLTVLIRAPRQMNVIEVSGLLRPLDLIHLGGHFGIPKVDPGTVMVPAPPGH